MGTASVEHAGQVQGASGAGEVRRTSSPPHDRQLRVPLRDSTTVRWLLRARCSPLPLDVTMLIETERGRRVHSCACDENSS